LISQFTEDYTAVANISGAKYTTAVFIIH